MTFGTNNVASRVARSEGRRQPSPAFLRVAALGLALLAVPATAQDFRIDPPIAGCKLGVDCWPLILFDHDPTPGISDFACANATYDGHHGTDFGVIDRTRIAEDIDVVAVASGVVLRLRSGETDGLAVAQGRAALSGRDCGDGLVIDHGGGWQSQYCHLRRGSVAAAVGQKVERGQRLGGIGMTGAADFPHVHLNITKDGKPVDPFAPDGRPAVCPSPGGQPVVAGLWREGVRGALAHPGATVVGLGLSALEAPDRWRLRSGLDRQEGAAPEQSGFSVWVDLVSPAAGDQVTLRLLDPAGKLILAKTRKVEGPTALLFTSYWVPRPAEGFALGVWTLEATSRRARDGREDRRLRRFPVVAPRLIAGAPAQPTP